jgi:hypothetical protein
MADAELARLRDEIAAAKADRDAAQRAYDALAPKGERLFAAIAEHRARSAELQSAQLPEEYAQRLGELQDLQFEIDRLRASVNISEFHDAKRALAAANGLLNEVFLAMLQISCDRDGDDELMVHVQTRTWLSNDMALNRLRSIERSDVAGEWLGDNLLLPASLRRLWQRAA